jgi:hypothetical protein
MVVANGSGLNLRGGACCPHSCANLSRLGLGEAMSIVPGDSGGERWLDV